MSLQAINIRKHADRPPSVLFDLLRNIWRSDGDDTIVLLVDDDKMLGAVVSPNNSSDMVRKFFAKQLGFHPDDPKQPPGSWFTRQPE